MILGVDHIALSCNDVGSGVQQLGKIGYRAKFVQEGIINHSAKRHLLKSYKPIHSLAYCQSESGISIELTQHSDELVDGISPYQLLLSGPVKNIHPFVDCLPPQWENAWRTILGCAQPMAGLWQTFHAQLWYESQGVVQSPFLIRALMVPVHNLTISEKFWVNGLRCRVVNRGILDDNHKWLHVAFRAPVKAWSLDIILVEGNKRIVMPYLDDPGFPCLALITSRITESRDIAIRMGGHDASDQFQLLIGNNVLNILLLRGPDNELIELIEFKNSS